MADRLPVAVSNNPTRPVAQPPPRRNGGYVPHETSVYYRGPDAHRMRPVDRPPPAQSLPRGRSMTTGSSRGSSGSPVRSHRSRRQRQRSRSRSRRRPPSSSRSRSRSRSLSRARYAPREDPDRPKDRYTLLKAAKCAALGAGLEAFRARNEPGPWLGRKGKRMALAAASGVAVGSIRQGSMHSSGWAPYAEALCTGFFAVEWYKKIGRDTHHEETAAKEQEQWRREKRRSGK